MSVEYLGDSVKLNMFQPPDTNLRKKIFRYIFPIVMLIFNVALVAWLIVMNGHIQTIQAQLKEKNHFKTDTKNLINKHVGPVGFKNIPDLTYEYVLEDIQEKIYQKVGNYEGYFFNRAFV